MEAPRGLNPVPKYADKRKYLITHQRQFLDVRKAATRYSFHEYLTQPTYLSKPFHIFKEGFEGWGLKGI